jgi:hypothetical protein
MILRLVELSQAEQRRDRMGGQRRGIVHPPRSIPCDAGAPQALRES